MEAVLELEIWDTTVAVRNQSEKPRTTSRGEIRAGHAQRS